MERKNRGERYKGTLVRSSRQSCWWKGKPTEISLVPTQSCFHVTVRRQPQQQHMCFLLSLSLGAFIHLEKDQVFQQWVRTKASQFSHSIEFAGDLLEDFCILLGIFGQIFFSKIKMRSHAWCEKCVPDAA